MASASRIRGSHVLVCAAEIQNVTSDFQGELWCLAERIITRNSKNQPGKWFSLKSHRYGLNPKTSVEFGTRAALDLCKVEFRYSGILVCCGMSSCILWISIARVNTVDN